MDCCLVNSTAPSGAFPSVSQVVVIALVLSGASAVDPNITALLVPVGFFGNTLVVKIVCVIYS